VRRQGTEVSGQKSEVNVANSIRAATVRERVISGEPDDAYP
jgi:hypothetical protein